MRAFEGTRRDKQSACHPIQELIREQQLHTILDPTNLGTATADQITVHLQTVDQRVQQCQGQVAQLDNQLEQMRPPALQNTPRDHLPDDFLGLVGELVEVDANNVRFAGILTGLLYGKARNWITKTRESVDMLRDRNPTASLAGQPGDDGAPWPLQLPHERPNNLKPAGRGTDFTRFSNAITSPLHIMSVVAPPWCTDAELWKLFRKLFGSYLIITTEALAREYSELVRNHPTFICLQDSRNGQGLIYHQGGFAGGADSRVNPNGANLLLTPDRKARLQAKWGLQGGLQVLNQLVRRVQTLRNADTAHAANVQPWDAHFTLLNELRSLNPQCQPRRDADLHELENFFRDGEAPHLVLDVGDGGNGGGHGGGHGGGRGGGRGGGHGGGHGGGRGGGRGGGPGGHGGGGHVGGGTGPGDGRNVRPRRR